MKKNDLNTNRIVLICCLAYFVSYFCRKDFAAAMAGMLEAGDVTKADAGYIGMALFVFYGAGQLVSGYLGDRINPTQIIAGGLLATAFANILMPIVPTPSLMIPVWALNGFAQAMLWPPIVRILSDNLEHAEFVRANLYVTAAAHISSVLLYLYVPVCLEFFSWETVFYTASAVSFASMIVFAIAMRKVIFSGNYFSVRAIGSSTAASGASGEKYSLVRLIKVSRLIPVLVCIIMVGILRDGIESWLPTLYSEAFNRDASESVLLSVSLPIFAIISITAITTLHKFKLFNNEVKGSVVAFSVSLIFSVCLLFLIKSESTVGRIACLTFAALVCACMHAANFLLISCLTGRYSRYGKASTMSGLTNSCTYIGAAISMYAFPSLSENLGWAATIAAWVAVCAVGIAALLASLKGYSRFISDNCD